MLLAGLKPGRTEHFNQFMQIFSSMPCLNSPAQANFTGTGKIVAHRRNKNIIPGQSIAHAHDIGAERQIINGHAGIIKGRKTGLSKELI